MTGLPADLQRTLRRNVCPRCGLAGWAREGFGYCRLHSERPEEPFASLKYAPGARANEPSNASGGDGPTVWAWFGDFGRSS